MIITLYLALLGVSFLFLFYGQYANLDLPKLTGFLLIFILGTIMNPIFPDAIEICQETNTSVIYQYGDNYTGYHWDYDTPRPDCNPNDLSCIALFHTWSEKECLNAEQTNHPISYWMMITSILGFSMIGLERRNSKKDDDNY